ncbi:MAG: glutamine--fructose-6-phosphate transaminase (isomerizing) [Firmicutes bacterium]|nr:glutamine--fructose-6-phosphate transaminase (isomerizing) [Bacillota bacterium]
MCGIIGYLGNGGAIKHTVDGLEKLEYRGYDSAGLSYLDSNKINTVKSVGNVAALSNRVYSQLHPNSSIAIGHTRWATHGGVTEVNTHPHVSNDGRVSVVHNGIIENYVEIIEFLKSHGIVMKSQTDTEVIPNLVSLYMKDDFLSAVKKAAEQLAGSFAILVMAPKFPDMIIAARRGRQPLLIAPAKNHTIVTSDVLACGDMREYYSLDDGEFAVITKSTVVFSSGQKTPTKMPAKVKPPTRGKYTTYMEKEIFEIPAVIRNIEREYRGIDISPIVDVMQSAGTIHITGCGTAYHAGLMLGQMIEANLKIRVRNYIASELPYTNPLIKKGDVAIVISQSGETADTLSAMQFLKSRDIPIIAICNVESSSIARYSDYLLPTHAGPEVAVASTKAFIAQVVVGAILTSDLDLESLSRQAKVLLTLSKEMKDAAKRYSDIRRIFFLGKGADAINSLEAALKVKEITYRHCEGFPSGELKHGTLSLVDSETLCVILNSTANPAVKSKLDNAAAEVAARGSHVMHIAVPDPLIATIPAQLFALYLAQELKINPDQPRNLAKSVTVE